MKLMRRVRDWALRVFGGVVNVEPTATFMEEFGKSAVPVTDILNRTIADLRELERKEGKCADARGIINKAMDELSRHEVGTTTEEALMERCLEKLPERDLTILRHFKQGKKHREIAALMSTDVESVRRSLINTYADLRMQMRSHGGGTPSSSDSLARTG